MALNESKGNMYEFVTHTWNTIKGECLHGCTYCYMKRFGNQKPVRFDQSELKTDLGTGNFIFVGSSCDMFAPDIPMADILKTLDHCHNHDNKYLFQTKNPSRLQRIANLLPKNSVICTTLESNVFYPEIMRNSPRPYVRAEAMRMLAFDFETYVTIEPIMRFDLYEFLDMIALTAPEQVNVGADSGNNNLPEPTPHEIKELIRLMKHWTTVNEKKNLKRLLP